MSSREGTGKDKVSTISVFTRRNIDNTIKIIRTAINTRSIAKRILAETSTSSVESSIPISNGDREGVSIFITFSIERSDNTKEDRSEVYRSKSNRKTSSVV